jgi:signal transduction histidine kinase
MDDLVAVAIHDAKNTLHALSVCLVEAKRDFSGKDSSTDKVPSLALERATAMAAKLSSRLVELLALYRAGENCLRLSIEDHSLADFIADVMEEFAGSQMGDRKTDIETDFSLAADIGEWAFDAYLVKFALLDALRNAQRFARQKIRFSLARQPGGGIRFRVEDDGAGYSPAILRSNETDDRAFWETMTDAGSGLGLHFARTIAASHVTPEGGRGRLELANDGFARGGAGLLMTLP